MLRPSTNDYHFRPQGNVVTSDEEVYGDLEKCDRVAYKSTFEMGLMAGILTSFVVLVAVGLASRRSHASRTYLAFFISMGLFSILYIQE